MRLKAGIFCARYCTQYVESNLFMYIDPFGDNCYQLQLCVACIVKCTSNLLQKEQTLLASCQFFFEVQGIYM